MHGNAAYKRRILQQNPKVSGEGEPGKAAVSRPAFQREKMQTVLTKMAEGVCVEMIILLFMVLLFTACILEKFKWFNRLIEKAVRFLESH